MGKRIIILAKERSQKIAVSIERLNHMIFLFLDEGLPADKHNWLRRKANVAKHFGESSLRLKKDLDTGKMALDATFWLNHHDYIAKGGAIPIYVKHAGMICVVTVSGLKDVVDHRLIVEALGLESSV